MKILITGGHATTALALIDELKSRKNIEIVFVGRQYALVSDMNLSYEYRQIEKRGIQFIHLSTGKMHGIGSIFKIIFGFFQSLMIIYKVNPDVVFSFGGYIGFPIAYAGKLLGKKVYIHEQVLIPGLSNRYVGKIADGVFLAFSQSKKYFNNKKTYVVGNPVRKEVAHIIDSLPIKTDKPIIYVTGGSLGSHSLNVHIENILPELTKSFYVIHQTGEVAEFNDYERLFEKNIKNYYVVPHIYDNQIGWVFKNSDLIVSRSGANTIFEIMSLKKPSILVPLPWSRAGEQQAHAQLLAEAGCAEIFDQSHDSEKLLGLISLVYHNKSKYINNFDTIQDLISGDATHKIISRIIPQ